MQKGDEQIKYGEDDPDYSSDDGEGEDGKSVDDGNDDEADVAAKVFPSDELRKGDSPPTWSDLAKFEWFLLRNAKRVKTNFGCRLLLKIYRSGVTFNVTATDILAELV